MHLARVERRADLPDQRVIRLGMNEHCPAAEIINPSAVLTVAARGQGEFEVKFPVAVTPHPPAEWTAIWRPRSTAAHMTLLLHATKEAWDAFWWPAES